MFNSNLFTDINKNIKKKMSSNNFKGNNLDNSELLQEKNPNSKLRGGILN